MGTDKTMNEPLPCCGVTPLCFEIEGPNRLVWYRLLCPVCGLHFTAPTKEKAIWRWNKREVTSLWQMKNG